MQEIESLELNKIKSSTPLTVDPDSKSLQVLPAPPPLTPPHRSTQEKPPRKLIASSSSRSRTSLVSKMRSRLEEQLEAGRRELHKKTI